MELDWTATLVQAAMNERQMQGQRLELLNQLGVGGFAEVWRCRLRSSGQERAVKIMNDITGQVIDECRHTRRALQNVDTDRVPQFHGLAQADLLDASGRVRTVHIIAMDLVMGGNVGHFTPANRRGIPWPDIAIRQVVKDVGTALVTLHKAGIIHADVKPDNIIFEWSGECKLCDFGVAVFLEDYTDPQTPMPVVGTPTHMAPELIHNVPCRYDTRVDVWCLGAVAYELLLGVTPVLQMPQLKNSPFTILPTQILTILERMESVPFDCAIKQIARQEELLNPTAPLNGRAERPSTFPKPVDPSEKQNENEKDEEKEKEKAAMEAFSKHPLVQFLRACLAICPADRFNSQQMMQLPFVSCHHSTSRRALVEWLRMP